MSSAARTASVRRRLHREAERKQISVQLGGGQSMASLDGRVQHLGHGGHRDDRDLKLGTPLGQGRAEDRNQIIAAIKGLPGGRLGDRCEVLGAADVAHRGHHRMTRSYAGAGRMSLTIMGLVGPAMV